MSDKEYNWTDYLIAAGCTGAQLIIWSVVDLAEEWRSKRIRGKLENLNVVGPSEKKTDKQEREFAVSTWDLPRMKNGHSFEITKWMNEQAAKGFLLTFEEQLGGYLVLIMQKRIRDLRSFRIPQRVPQRFQIKFDNGDGKPLTGELLELLPPENDE